MAQTVTDVVGLLVTYVVGLYPLCPYRPCEKVGLLAGMVSIFARTALIFARNPQSQKSFPQRRVSQNDTLGVPICDTVSFWDARQAYQKWEKTSHCDGLCVLPWLAQHLKRRFTSNHAAMGRKTQGTCHVTVAYRSLDV